MKRSAGVTVSAVAAGLGSGLVGLLALLGLVAALLGNAATVPPPPGVPAIFLRFALFGGVAILLGLCGWGIATAVGLFRLKSWARWSMITFSTLWTLFTLMSTLMIWVIPMPATPQENAAFVRIFVVVFYGLQAILGGFWLFYFNRPSVRAQFGEGSAAGAGPGGRPLSISIIGWLLIVGGVSTAGIAMLPLPATVLGMVLKGWAGTAFYLAYSVVSISVGVGLLRLRPISRIAAIVIFAQAILNSLLMLVLPGMDQRVAEMYSAFPGFTAPDTSAAIPGILFALVFSVLPIWFLVARRAAFEPTAAGPPVSEPPAPPPLPGANS